MAMICKEFIEIEGEITAQVTFSLPSSIWADTITLVGDFNDWNRQSHPFVRTRTGEWTITVELKAPRAYQFRYLQGGNQWMNDHNADAYVHTIYGSDNFVVIADPNFKQHCDERTLYK